MITFPDPDVLLYGGIHEAISAAGYGLAQTDGQWVTSGPGTPAENEIAVQAIINGYNFVQELKKRRKAEIKAERSNRYYLLYPPDLVVPDEFLELTHRDLFGNMVDLTLDLWASINNNSKTANASWQKVLDVRSAARTGLQAVNAATTKQQVLAVTVAWPA